MAVAIRDELTRLDPDGAARYTANQAAFDAELSALASFGCGLIGPFVVVKRIAFLAGGIAHSVPGGMNKQRYIEMSEGH